MSGKGFLKIDTRTGRVIDDDDQVLRDGQRILVPLNMCDSKQREVVEHFEHLRAEDALAQHRPGPRYIVDEATRARVEQARAEGIKEMCDAWKRKPDANSGSGYGSGEFRGQQPGDQCTINGQPGHLDHRLQCVPDKQDSAPPRVMDAATAQKIKDAAWRASVEEDENAWRGPAR